MDEGGGLENRYMGNCIVGSNPTPSANHILHLSFANAVFCRVHA